MQPHSVLDPVRPGAGGDVGGHCKRDDLITRSAVDKGTPFRDREARVVARWERGREPDPPSRGQISRGGERRAPAAAMSSSSLAAAALVDCCSLLVRSSAAAAAEPLADRLEPAKGARVGGLEHEV